MTVSRRLLSLAFAALVALAGAVVSPALGGRADSVGAASVEHPATPPRLTRHDGRLQAPDLAVAPVTIIVEPPRARPLPATRERACPVLPLVSFARCARGPPLLG
jgi:hypothetical protein